jgi:hypothetical protein
MKNTKFCLQQNQVPRIQPAPGANYPCAAGESSSPVSSGSGTAPPPCRKGCCSSSIHQIRHYFRAKTTSHQINPARFPRITTFQTKKIRSKIPVTAPQIHAPVQPATSECARPHSDLPPHTDSPNSKKGRAEAAACLAEPNQTRKLTKKKSPRTGEGGDPQRCLRPSSLGTPLRVLRGSAPLPLRSSPHKPRRHRPPALAAVCRVTAQSLSLRL